MGGRRCFDPYHGRSAPIRRAKNPSGDSTEGKSLQGILSQEQLSELRQRLHQMLGLSEERISVKEFERFGTGDQPGLVASTEKYQVWQVRWPILNDYIAEGLLITPLQKTREDCWIVLPDADETPEQAFGIGVNPAPHHQHLQSLANAGATLLIPTLINRQEHSPAPPLQEPKPVGQSHREWLHRQSFHMGRHLLGFETQAVQSGIDILQSQNPKAKVFVSGYGEGGLVALLSSAADERIQGSIVSGYFAQQVSSWEQPIFRNIQSFERDLGLSGLLHLHSGRPLLIQAINGPKFEDRKGNLNPEHKKSLLNELLQSLPAQVRQNIALTEQSSLEAKSFAPFSVELGNPNQTVLKDQRNDFKNEERHARVFQGIEKHVQQLIRTADFRRDELYLYKAEPALRPGAWSTRPRHSTLNPDNFIRASKDFRKTFSREAMGAFEEELLPFNPRSRQILESPHWTAYDVVLDVYQGFQTWGALLLPKDLKENEKRPVVVLQHGRNGIPLHLINAGRTGYADSAAELAKRGFIVFVPHNIYRGEDRYRWLNRKANTLGASLFSFIIPSHRQALNWLKTLPHVDPERIAFYGLSYGGESAMRLPSILEDYSAVICSGDFNQWTRKVAATDYPNSFMYSIEWEMPYWNLGSTFDYAEMAYLIFPRPFMVERGHHDRVAPDSWVAYEYAKVKYLYDQFGLGDRTEFLVFQGGHAMANPEAYDFLHRHLNWPHKK